MGRLNKQINFNLFARIYQIDFRYSTPFNDWMQRDMNEYEEIAKALRRAFQS